MKTVILVFVLFSVQQLCAQNNAIDKFYRDYQQKYSLDVVSVSGKMLPLLIDDKKGKEKEELIMIINKLSGLKMLSKSNPKDGKDLFSSATSVIPKQYEVILSLDEADRKVKCYTVENKDGKITELLMVAWQWGRFMVLSLTGNIELTEIYRLTQSINFEGLDKAKKANILRQ
jgi:hypothetical protein